MRVDDEPWELYDIDADGTELNDLAGENPLMVERLEKLWNAWKAQKLEDRLR